MKKYTLFLVVLSLFLIGFKANAAVKPVCPYSVPSACIPTPALMSPTVVVSSSTKSQYISSDSFTGAINASVVTLNFVSNGVPSTIKTLVFTTTTSGSSIDAITSVMLNGVTAPVVNGSAKFMGLNIVVPSNPSGLTLPVYISYAPVGPNGIPSGSTSALSLFSVNGVSYVNGGGVAYITAPTMTLVSSKPVFLATQPTNKISSGLVEAIDVTVSADASGNISLNSLPISVVKNGNITLGAGTGIVVKDANNAPIFTTSSAYSSNVSIIKFTGGYTIQAGTSQTFKIFIPVAKFTGNTANTVSISTSLPIAGMTWTDMRGGAVGAQGAALIFGYPSTFISVVYN